MTGTTPAAEMMDTARTKATATQMITRATQTTVSVKPAISRKQGSDVTAMSVMSLHVCDNKL